MSDKLPANTNALVGWLSTVEDFVAADAKVVAASLNNFINVIHEEGAGYLQRDAWEDYIPGLQKELGDTVRAQSAAAKHLALLEYRFQFDGRRPDFLLLANGTIAVVEFKKKSSVLAADVDQVMAYARDLLGYHRTCNGRRVIPILVPTLYKGARYVRDSVWICGLEDLDPLIQELDGFGKGATISAEEFISEDSYCPLPSLIAAARELFEQHAVRHVSRAYANTQPAIDAVRDISVRASTNKSRHLVLINGVPGAGKTLVGLQAVHSGELETLRTSTEGAPAVFLSGNGPLVQVLRHVIKGSPGGTSALATVFVQDVKSFREKYIQPGRVPNQHIIVSDEAQRAWDASKMARDGGSPLSEPHVFIDIASRVPDWSVFVGLIGSGQEIHDGEESGVEQWFDALATHATKEQWVVHVPPVFSDAAQQRGLNVETNVSLSLDKEIRFHLAQHLHDWVRGLLDGRAAADLTQLAQTIKDVGFRMYVTRDLQLARDYATSRYEGSPEARYGIIASSRDKELARHGIPNTWQDTKFLKVGPWFSDPPRSAGSCCKLSSCATEFQCQGLEIDFAIVGWGTDLLWEASQWNSNRMRRYANAASILDAHILRTNAYRVLLTRGRDGFIVFAPRIRELDSTVARLLECGVEALT